MDEFHILENITTKLNIETFVPYQNIYPLFLDIDNGIDYALDQISDYNNIIIGLDVIYMKFVNPNILEYIIQDIKNYAGSNLERVLYSIAPISLFTYEESLTHLFGFVPPLFDNKKTNNYIKYKDYSNNLNVPLNIIYLTMIASHIFNIIDVDNINLYSDIFLETTNVFRNTVLNYHIQYINELTFWCDRFIDKIDLKIIDDLYLKTIILLDVDTIHFNKPISDLAVKQCVNFGACRLMAGYIYTYLCISLYKAQSKEKPIKSIDWDEVDVWDTLLTYSDNDLFTLSKTNVFNYTRLDIIYEIYNKIKTSYFKFMDLQAANCGLSLCVDEFTEDPVLVYGNSIKGFKCIKLNELYEWIKNNGLKAPYNPNVKLSKENVKFLLEYTFTADLKFNELLHNILHP